MQEKYIFVNSFIYQVLRYLILKALMRVLNQFWKVSI